MKTGEETALRVAKFPFKPLRKLTALTLASWRAMVHALEKRKTGRHVTGGFILNVTEGEEPDGDTTGSIRSSIYIAMIYCVENHADKESPLTERRLSRPHRG